MPAGFHAWPAQLEYEPKAAGVGCRPGVPLAACRPGELLLRLATISARDCHPVGTPRMDGAIILEMRGLAGTVFVTSTGISEKFSGVVFVKEQRWG